MVVPTAPAMINSTQASSIPTDIESSAFVIPRPTLQRTKPLKAQSAGVVPLASAEYVHVRLRDAFACVLLRSH